MGEQVSWLVELAVKPGQLDNFRALTGEMVKSTHGEPGVLSYERFVSEDGKFVHALERYADSAAALAHLRPRRPAPDGSGRDQAPPRAERSHSFVRRTS